MNRKSVCAGLLLVCAAFLNAEPDTGKLLPRFKIPSFTNVFLEGTAGIAGPLSFMAKSNTAMTDTGWEFSLGMGYNWDGWLLGVEAGRDMWGQGKGPGALMNNFNNNLLLFKFQRVLSKNTLHFLPSWLEIVPGGAVGANWITTDYYPSERAKREGRELHVELGNTDAVCLYYRASLESSVYLGTDMFIPYLGADYDLFYDKSIGGGYGMFWTAFLGVRTYPFGFVNDFRRHAAEKAAAKAAADKAEQERIAAEQAQLAAQQAEQERIAQAQHAAMVASWGKAEAAISIEPAENFTPDNDGVNDTAAVTPSAKYLEYDPQSWKIEILDPQMHPFRTMTGNGKLPERWIWDGLSDNGEQAFSRDTYTAKLSVVPDTKDTARTGQTILEAQTKVETGILMQEVKPQQEWRIVVNTIYFDPDKATFNKITEAQRKSNKDTLDSVARQLNAHPGCDTTVEGYANNVSNTERENREELVPLSQARAEAIMQQLVDRGLDAKHMNAIGMGGANPLAKWEDHANWWKNRRVEFRVVKK